MHGIKSWFVLFIGLLSLFIACHKEAGIVPVVEPEAEINGYEGVDRALWIYFARFEEEGLQRGIELDLRAANITGVIEKISEDRVAGQCTYHPFLPNEVTIDQDFWRQAPDLTREFIVFHELGHCALGRDHREAVFPNGVCMSIMRSGLEDCRDNYHSLTRASYLNELFDPQFRNQIQ